MCVLKRLIDFNLIVSCGRGREDNACSELWYFLKEMGDEKADIQETGLSGLIVAKTSMDPHEVVSKIRDLASSKPWEVRYILKIVPIDVVVDTSIEAICEAIDRLKDRISEEETFRVTVNKRASRVNRMAIIKAVAERIERKVDLTNYDKLVLIEVIGEKTGVSILKPEEVVSIVKIKRERGYQA